MTMTMMMMTKWQLKAKGARNKRGSGHVGCRQREPQSQVLYCNFNCNN